MRKSLFQRLEPWDKKHVLDLYAGIGSFGIEALSRGAEHVTFVEHNHVAARLIHRNLTKAGAGDACEVVIRDVERFMDRVPGRYDVIFADPPYRVVEWADIFPLVESAVAAGGVFAMELSSTANVPEGVDVRKYGKTKVALWRRAI